MIAVIFEVWPREERRERYFDLARELRAELEGIDGFVSVERFVSLSDPGKILSLSFFRDEAAVAAWRNRAVHRHAQAAGRADIFSDYRLRVAAVLRDYGMQAREEVPDDSRGVHRKPGRPAPIEIGAARSRIGALLAFRSHRSFRDDGSIIAIPARAAR